MTISLALCAQLAFAAALGAGLLLACRWLQRRSRLCGGLVVAGLLLRAIVTLALFWTSYLNLPILRQLHSGNGFWKLAIDAPVYYLSALNAAEHGLATVLRGSPSPAFVKGLALWMRAVGPSPVSGAYLNLWLYVLLCLVIVAVFRPTGQWREDLPCAVSLAAVTFSPVLFVYGSQPLKDVMFVFLLAIVCLAAFALMPVLVLDRGVARRSRLVDLGLGATFLAAIYVIAGIRGYYGLLTWTALAWVLFVFAWCQRPARLVRYSAACVLVLIVVWFSYMTGADLAYLNPYGNSIVAVWDATHPGAPRRVPTAGLERSGTLVTMVDAYRSGFVLTPGATNIGSEPADLNGPSPITRGVAAPTEGGGLRHPLSAVTLGLGLIFVPVSVLRALSIVDFTGGRGLLAITDADTVLMDLTILAAIALLVRRRSAIRERLPYVCFMGTLAAAAALLMAYIVTNFGTLFRLRLMVSVPLWMLPLALSPRVPRPVEPGAPDTGRDGPAGNVDSAVARDAAGSAAPRQVARPALLDLLVCPACALPLRTGDAGVEGTALRCARCGLVVPIRQGIPRFIEDIPDRPADPAARLAARTQASFGYEWTYFHRWHDSGEISFLDYFETADLSGAREGRVLDAGCGMGRHARQLAAHVGHVIAIDFSRAIDQAAINTRGVGNVDCVQADLLRLPFADGSFEYIYSFGVLHHLIDTETAVRGLVAKLKPGGRLRVYLYWKRHGWSGAVLWLVNSVRPVTTRLPFRLLRWGCWVLSAVLWLALILPYRLLMSAGVRGMSRWPLFVYAKYPFWILYNDQFDRFSAPLEKRYDREEVSALLEAAGLRDVRVDARLGWIAEGVKPAGEGPCAG